MFSLGNLLLISGSSKSPSRDKCFTEKQHIFANGNYSEVEVSEYTHWDVNTIKVRGVKLLEFMESRWQIEIPDKEKYLLIK